MSVVNKLERITVDEYLDGEERGDVRHEYVDGVIYAMVGASVRHNMITGALFSLLHRNLRGSPCHVFQSDMKVRVGQVFYYPDIVMTCSELDLEARYLSTPILIAEVLSPSTEARDRLEKMVSYQSLPSLKEYLLVAQDKVHVEVMRRVDMGWRIEICSYGDRLNLESAELDVPVETIYEDVMGQIL